MAEINNEQLEKLDRFFNLIGDANEALTIEEREKKRIQQGAEERRAKISKTLNQVGDSLSSFGKAVTNPQPGLSKFNSSISSAGSAAADVASNFGILGKVAGGVIKAFTALFTAALEQNDNLMKSYNALSEMGSVTAGGFTELGRQLRALGLTTKEAEKFEKTLGIVSKELTMFRGSVSSGRDEFVKIASAFIGPNNEVERVLARLGMTSDLVRDGLADYLSMQTRLGVSQRRNTEDLQKESQKYLITMRELQELTGMTRDEQQKIRDQQMSDARFALHLNKMTLDGKKDEAENLQMYLMAYQKQFGEQAAAGLKDRIVNEGRLTTDQASASFQSAANAYDEAMTAQRKGIDYFMKGLVNTGAAIMQRTNQLRGAFNIQAEGLRDLGLESQAVLGALGLMDVNSEEYAKTLERLRQIQKGNGKDIENNIRTAQKERAIRLALDDALQTVGSGLVTVMAWVQRAMFQLGKIIAYMIDKFGFLVGIKDTNLSRFFKDAADIKKELDAQKELTENANKIVGAREKEIAMLREGIAIDYTSYAERERKKIKDLQSQVSLAEGADLAAGGFGLSSNHPLIKELENARRWEKEYTDLSKMSRDQQIEALTQKYQREKSRYDEEKKKEDEIDKLHRQRVVEETRTPEVPELTDSDFSDKSKLGTYFANNVKGNVHSAGVIESRKNKQAELIKSGTGREDEIMRSLRSRVKFSSDATQGGDASPQLLALAEKISQAFGSDLTQITAFNDAFHQERFITKGKKSKHLIGKAMDFTLAEHLVDTPEKTKALKELFKGMGAINVRDEYFSDRTKDSTGPHFHLEVAKYGGLFSGPDKGYPVMLHGKNESAWPEAELKKLLKDVQKSSLSQYKEQLMAEMGLSTPTNEGGTGSENTHLVSALNTFSAKLDTVISRLERSNSIQDDLLTYTRA